ncbi:MAG TPA: hypothetical protein PLD62_04055 [Candidatus Cloacimonadota bacterium]|nr:hypothetical protein [Candidatus Cloacimonadota bacterium]
MRKRGFKYLFFISLTFNIAFLGGIVFHIVINPFPPGLPPKDMKPPVRDFFFEKKDEMQPLGENFMNSRGDFLNSLRTADFNEEKSLELMQISVQKHMEMEEKIGKSMIELRKKLTQEEAEKMFCPRGDQERFPRKENNIKYKYPLKDPSRRGMEKQKGVDE